MNQLADADVVRRRPLSSGAEARSNTASPIEKGKRYAPYTRDTTDREQLPVWCIEHREPVFINDLPAEYHRYITQIPSNEPAARGRHDVARAAVGDLPAAHRQRSRARHHHDSELREERVHRASPECDAAAWRRHGHRARQRETRTGSSTSTSTRSGGCSRRPRKRVRWQKKPTPPRARSSPR